MTQFYVLEPEGGRIFGKKWAYAEKISPFNLSDCQYCPVCGSPVSMLKWEPPFRVKFSQSEANRWGDFVWGTIFPMLISSRFKEIYLQHNLTGLSEISEPVEIIKFGRKDPVIIPNLPVYHSVFIPWGGIDMDDNASELRHNYPEEIKCSYCRGGSSGKSFSRLVIREENWNGDDLCILRNFPGTIIVSNRFYIIVKKYNLTNIWLIPVEKYAYDDSRLELWHINS